MRLRLRLLPEERGTCSTAIPAKSAREMPGKRARALCKVRLRRVSSRPARLGGLCPGVSYSGVRAVLGVRDDRRALCAE